MLGEDNDSSEEMDVNASMPIDLTWSSANTSSVMSEQQISETQIHLVENNLSKV